MDHQTFDRLTRLFGASGSRRYAGRALLGTALLGATTRMAAAAPCDNGKNPRCRCGQNSTCPPGKCFRNECNGDQLCCTGSGLIICGNTCCQNVGTDPCDPCLAPGATDVQAAEDDPCPSGLAGSYRRP